MKRYLKIAVNALVALALLPISLPARLLSSGGKPNFLFSLLSHTLSLMPGVIGVYLRRGFYVCALERCALDVTIDFGTIFAFRGTCIGSDTYIGANCTVGLANIGNSVLIGSNVDLIGSPRLHNFDRTDIPIKKQGGDLVSVCVGDCAWVGNSSVIIGNVGAECVVGAGSVVTSDCDDWGIYVGNPARKLRDRREADSE